MCAPILDVQDMGFQYSSHSARVDALRGVNFSLYEGESLGIVGESGSGKSTLARLLIGALTPTSGRLIAFGAPWSGIKPSDARRRHVQMVFQDPYSALNPRQSIGNAIAEAVRATGASRSEGVARAKDLLERVGLDASLRGRRPHQLSGGQCQRVCIARALATEPSLLIADEPTSSLDVSVQAQVLNLLIDLRVSRRMALVLISHDLAVVANVTDRILVVHRGRIVESGSTMEVLSRPRDAYTRLLLSSVPGLGSATEIVADGARCP